VSRFFNLFGPGSSEPMFTVLMIRRESASVKRPTNRKRGKFVQHENQMKIP
jgi:hypothetical protein